MRSALPWMPHILGLAFIAGLVVAATAGGNPAVGVAMTAVALVTTRVLLGQPVRVRLAACVLAIGVGLTGWAWGALRLHQTAVRVIEQSRTVTVVGVVETTPHRQGDRVRMRLQVLRMVMPSDAATANLRVVLDVAPQIAGLRPGRLVRVTGRLGSPFAADAPDWWRRYLERQMIAGRLVARSVQTVGERGGIGGLRDRVRNALSESAGRGLSGERATLVRGMALGGGGDLSEATAATMRDAGIWHLLAVSGQNIAIVASGLCRLLLGFGLRRRVALSGALALVVVYCLACDGGASVARAAIVALLGLAGELVARGSDRVYLLILGGALLLAWQPRSLDDPGLHLSFAAVVGLMVVAPPLRTWLCGFVSQTHAAIAAQSLAASLATAPVTIAHFGVVSVVGVAVNMAVAPVAPVVVVCALLGAVGGLVAAPLGLVPTYAAGIAVEAIRVAATVGAGLPGATAVAGWRTALIAALLAVAIPALGWWLWQAQVPVVRPRWRQRAVGVVVTGAVVLLMGTHAASAPPWPTVPEVAVLDVGQGDAILLRSPEGASALIDTGPGDAPAPVIRQLERRGVRRLTLLALTHDQADHAGGAGQVLSQLPVQVVVAPGALAAAQHLSGRLGRSVTPVAAGSGWRIGQWQLRVLWPRRNLAGAAPNDAALVMIAECATMRVLLTADAEGAVVRRLVIGHVDVLKVAHHGSADSELPAVLAQIHPRAAAVSVGRGNAFGHPAPSTVASLAAAHVPLWRTDREGSISFRVVGGVLVARRE